MRTSLFIASLLLLIFAGITYVALELNGVVVVETNPVGSQQPRRTHIWYVRSGTKLLLEAGHPDNPWVADIQNQSTLILHNGTLSGEYAVTLHDPKSHTLIRKLMREKYTWRDRWISLIFDPTQSFAIELTPLSKPSPGPT